MAKYDVVLIHPPAVYDFRRKKIYPGVYAASVEGAQFTKVPIGMLSIASWLDAHGYKTIIDNLGERMARSRSFDAEAHLKELQASVYAVGMHFQQHSPGAVEIARLIKRLHPDSAVIVGGVTATRFHTEILQKYEFIDMVIRGEAEKPFLELMRTLEKGRDLAAVPNLSYRAATGEVRANPLAEVSASLDEYDFTRFDLLQPQTSIFAPDDSLPRWSLEVCRGCIYNCAICGGSAYSYKTYLGRSKPAFRSPAKIIDDIRSLNRRGVRIIGLYQDMRMGGEAYWRELLRGLKSEDLQIDRLSLDLLAPADEPFIEAIARTGRPVTVHFCPDSGCEKVRQLLGRRYSNDDLLRTVRLCHKYLIPVTTFFSAGLAGEERENIEETRELMDRLSSMEQIMFTRSRSMGIGGSVPLGGPISGPVLLDPGSPAFDNPQKYGYKLLYRDLEAYIRGLSEPSWHKWTNYETDLLDRDSLLRLQLESAALAIDRSEAYELFGAAQAAAERERLEAIIRDLNQGWRKGSP